MAKQIVYSTKSTKLPSWLKPKKGRLWYASDQVTSAKLGPWDYVVDYSQSLATLRQPSPVTDRRISAYARNLSVFANRFPLDHPDVQLFYTANFLALLRKPLTQGIKLVGKDAIVLAPERGAGVIKLMLTAQGFESAQIPRYQASRIIMSDNYTVALRLDTPIPQGKKVLHVDDCGAAGGTEAAGYAVFKEVIGGKPEVYVSVIGVGVPRAVAKRTQELTTEKINFGIFVGDEAHQMDDHYYLILTSEEKQLLSLPSDYTYRVGDMGVAMELDSPERQTEIPLLRKLAGTTNWDQQIIEITTRIANHPKTLVKETQAFRRLLVSS